MSAPRASPPGPPGPAGPPPLRPPGRRRWTGLVGAALRLRLGARIRRISDLRRWGVHAAEIQARQLRGLLLRAAGTEVGRAAGFARLAAHRGERLIPEFQAALPLGDYEAFRPRLARMREAGEPDVLWPGLVMDWAQTSGTTGGQKYIPVSREMMRSNYLAAMDIFVHAARFGCSLPDLFSGRLLFLGGSTNVSVDARGVRTGDLSGLSTALIRWPMTEVCLPRADVALMDHWPSKIEAMARQCSAHDVRCVFGMASWSLVLFQKILELARARGPGVRCLRDAWPNLRLLVHGGVRYPPFDPRVREAWSGEAGEDIPVRVEVYPASEGFIGVQDARGDPGLRLHTDLGNFYEFVPLEEIDRPDARAFPCHKVERGQRYVVVMTTCAGLWRYIIGDVVQFDTIPPEGPPRLRIVGRHRQFINAFGENLIVEDIERAVVTARDATGVSLGEFTAAPVYPAPGRRAGIELAIEWGGEPAGELLGAFAGVFDDSLRRLNVDYDTKRTGDLGMGPPRITPLEPGAFHRWMEGRGRLGGQHKAPRCANHREVIEAILTVSGS